MALPVPASAWKYGKFIVRAAEAVIPAGYAYLESLLTTGNEDGGSPVWMKWTCVFTRVTPAGTAEDKAQVSFHLLNITGGAIDSTWTAGDFAAVKAIFETWGTAVQPVYPSSHTLTEYRAYRMEFDPLDPGPAARKGSGVSQFKESGPPQYVSATSKIGSGSLVAYQQAMSVTFRTAFPRHWGRIYMPGGGGTDANGRFLVANRNAAANGTFALISSLADAGFLAVVPMGQLNKQAFHALLGVTQVVVDDIPDVIRRRRAKQVAVRSIGA